MADDMEAGDSSQSQSPWASQGCPHEEFCDDNHWMCTSMSCCLTWLFRGFVTNAYGVIAPVVTLVLMFALLVIRLLQFTKFGGSHRVIQLKFLIRSWIFINAICAMIYPIAGVVIFYLVKNEIVGVLPSPILVVITDISILISFALGLGLIPPFTHMALRSIPVTIEYSENITDAAEALSEIFNCSFFWLIWCLARTKLPEAINPVVNHLIFGDSTKRWIKILNFALIGYNGISLLTLLFVVSLRIEAKGPRIMKHLDKKYVVYFANGMKGSIDFILSATMLLLVWLFYVEKQVYVVGSHSNRVLEITGWASISLTICSLLWFIKTCILLAWEAHAVNNKLNFKLLEAGKQLYFLGILGRRKYDVLNLLYDNNASKYHCLFGPLRCIMYPESKYWRTRDKKDYTESQGNTTIEHCLSNQKRNIVKAELLMPKKEYTPSLYDIRRVAQHLVESRHALSKNECASHILDYLEMYSKIKYSIDNTERRVMQTQDLKEFINCAAQDPNGRHSSSEESPNSDWEYFLEFSHVMRNNENPSKDSSGEISFESIQKWMIEAHENCLFLANVVSSAKEVADCLDNIISCILIFASFILWLLLSGLASTKLLVLIGSPLVLSNFIFGDAGKNFVQGLIFVFVMRPFDIGDVCNIGEEDQKLQIKSIGVWNTTFVKTTDKTLEVVYPNSELAKQKVTNHKTEHQSNSETEGKGNIASPMEDKGELPENNSSKQDKGTEKISSEGDSLLLSSARRHQNTGVSFTKPNE